MSDTDSGKTIAIVAHFTWIGWIVALIMQNEPSKKTAYGSFYLRQMLGLLLSQMACGFVMIIPILGWIAGILGAIAVFIFWIISLINAVNGEMKEVPVVGALFQDWFKSL